ncbi:MAG: phosphotransferase [Thioalkalispiraceae bacterium]
MDKRFEALNQWLATELQLTGYEITPASADASFRRYFRVQHENSSFIVMDAPPDKENCQPFIELSGILHGLGLHVPVVEKQDLQQGFLCLTDLGNRLYLDELSANSADALYADAMQALLRLQAYQGKAVPDYERELLLNEMELFRDWYLGRHLGLSLSNQQHALLNETFSLLADEALSQPRVLVHRDYHSRNLMVCEQNNPGIIDFQDAVMGPITYDLVSLLRDCYIQWPRQQVEDWVRGYHEKAQQQKLIGSVEVSQFLRWFDLMGIQRHLKAVGIFARLNYRDNKPGYLQDIPRTLSYIREVAPRHPQLKDFSHFIESVTRGLFDTVNVS